MKRPKMQTTQLQKRWCGCGAGHFFLKQEELQSFQRWFSVRTEPLAANDAGWAAGASLVGYSGSSGGEGFSLQLWPLS